MALHSFSYYSQLPFIIIIFFFFHGEGGFSPSPEEVGICEAVVRPYGYKCQEFEVTTEDGYILGMQRIPVGRNGVIGGARQPVLLQHGVLMDGMTWLLNSPEQSLAFVLADNGFDVWIGNIRGTRSSNRHVSLTPSDRAYWAWSWDELVENDFPAMVDLVAKQTKQKLHYVGHSLGTLIALASFSEGRLVDKLRSAALLCPIAYLDHMKTKLGILAARLFVGEILSNLLGLAEFNPKGLEASKYLKILCSYPDVNCYDLLTAFTAFRDGALTKYNYGVNNIQRYGQSTPPVYNLSNIPNSLPLYLSYGGRDSLSDTEDVEHLLQDLKLHETDQLVLHYVQNFAHADFIMGVSAKQVVYDSMMAFFRQI
ncbi:triacylglycerol lipase 2 isoform X2 [Dendrobium catenatum]|uniref:triacylglycerol lipase 2 isoform X2 n=1 Tax=Dendrobium catenatum TaxID=906689 RepID=UPI0010A0804D|nr:triacylglycerol lipase 2 isoform X2 [Dendrobium catenatum]